MDLLFKSSSGGKEGEGGERTGEREKNWRPDKKKKKNFYRLGKLGVRKEIRMVREKVNS